VCGRRGAVADKIPAVRNPALEPHAASSSPRSTACAPTPANFPQFRYILQPQPQFAWSYSIAAQALSNPGFEVVNVVAVPESIEKACAKVYKHVVRTHLPLTCHTTRSPHFQEFGIFSSEHQRGVYPFGTSDRRCGNHQDRICSLRSCRRSYRRRLQAVRQQHP
jgi:hypothetical protein